MLLPIPGSARGAGWMLFASAWCWARGGHRFTPMKPPCNTSSFTATPHPPSIAHCMLGIMSGCEGWRYCGKAAEPRAFLWAHFLVHYKPVMPESGPLDKIRLHLTRISVHRGSFALWSLSQCGFLQWCHLMSLLWGRVLQARLRPIHLPEHPSLCSESKTLTRCQLCPTVLAISWLSYKFTAKNPLSCSGSTGWTPSHYKVAEGD